MMQTDQQHRSDTVFAPWVEWRQDRCRRGRVLITAVNHRDGRAIHLDPTDLDARSGNRYRETMLELADGKFIATSDDPHCVDDEPGSANLHGAGLVWRGADRFVRRCHTAGLHRALTRRWIVAQFALALAGAVALSITLRTDGFELRAHPAQIPAIILLGLAAVSIHELGHALVTVHYGRRVRMAGLRLHLGSPAFYVESVDALLLNRRQRLIQAAAGPWAEWLVTSAVAITFLALPHHGAAAAILHRFVIVNTIVIASNLLPFVGLDGALLFADAVREPDLPFRASNPLSTRSAGRDRWITAYSAANALVAAGLLVMAGFFWWELFGNLVLRIWSLGAPGVAILAAIATALTCQIVRMLSTALSPIAPHAARVWSKTLFRAQRRWRVRAITALRVLPEIAELDQSDLGILAGQLQRVCVRDNLGTAINGPVYIQHPPRRDRSTKTTPLNKGAVTILDASCPSHRLVGAQLVLLPNEWQRFLAPVPNRPAARNP